jgi:perosamine synthetase
MTKLKNLKVPYFSPWINNDDKKAVLNALNHRWLTDGPMLKKFERKFASYIKSKFAIGTGSATQSLHLSLRSLDIGVGDEVIVPTFTFASTANAVIYCGAKPIFADVDVDTFNINPKEIEKKITKKTKAVIIVHYGGQSCDMDEILLITKKHKIHLVEDCAHSLGSKYRNSFCGSLGITGNFSFYPTKIITTGEGGMVTTRNQLVSKKIKLLRSQGMSIQATEREKSSKWGYDIIDLGYNYRLDEIRSSLGFSQLNRIAQINNSRKKIASKYDQKLKKFKGIITPSIKDNRNHIYHLYTIRITEEYPLSRDELYDKLSKNGIGSSVQYTPLHLMSYYSKKYHLNKKIFPNANLLKNQVLSLPIFPQMTLKQINYVISHICKN